MYTVFNLYNAEFSKDCMRTTTFFYWKMKTAKGILLKGLRMTILDKKRMHQHPLSNVNYLFSILLQANC